MYYILEVSEKLFNIYNNLNSALVHLFKLSEYKLNCSVKEFNEGCINSIFTIKNNKIMYTHLENNNLITSEYTNLPFELIFQSNFPLESKNGESKNGESKDGENKKYVNNSSEINVHLPPINTEIVITSPESEVDIEELKKRIDELNKLKDEEMNNLEYLNQNLHEQENVVIAEKFSVDAEKNKLKLDKEKWEEFKNIFNADKKIYRIMKEQLEANQIEDIPELFEKKYPIFAALDEYNLLDKPSEIYDYIKLLPNDDSVYIPNDSLLKNLFDNDNIVTSISLTELKDQNNNFDTSIETDDDK